MYKFLKKEKGITLIALVVTIIVLLILAGISIAMLTGENGILTQAQNAKNETENAQEEEQNILTGYENYINSATNQVLDDDLPGNEDLKTFITQWSVADGETIVLPIYEKQGTDEERGEKETYFNYNFTVDYGDGTIAEITSFDDEDRSHTYQTAGTYDIKITGLCEGWSFYNVGDSAQNLIQIKQWGVTQAKHIDFANCTNLSGQIPTPVKNSFTTVESFRLLFYNCTNLNSQIPENLFYNAKNAITLRNAFNYSGVTGNIPENLLSYCTKVENVAFLFDGSKNITGNIPENLFSNCSNLKTVYGVFKETSVTGTIPEKLLYNCQNLNNVGELFGECSGITGSIPEKLFINCPNITSAYATFEECTGLTGTIPENLFINQTQIKSIQGCFRNCTGLSDSQIRIVSKNITKAEQFCEGVNAKVTAYVPRGTAASFSGTSNVTVVEYDI